MSVSLKQWRFGLRVALFEGALLGVTAWAADCSLKQIALITLVSAAKNALQYLQTHPADTVSTDTQIIQKP
jgi:hypothetical protein